MSKDIKEYVMRQSKQDGLILTSSTMDKEILAVYLELIPTHVTTTKEIAPLVFADYDALGNIVGIEIAYDPKFCAESKNRTRHIARSIAARDKKEVTVKRPKSKKKKVYGVNEVQPGDDCECEKRMQTYHNAYCQHYTERS